MADMEKVEKVVKGLEQFKAAGWTGLNDYYLPIVADALDILKAQGHKTAQCNKCEFYDGVHNVRGHAPCSFWNIGGVMWNDYCSRFVQFVNGR